MVFINCPVCQKDDTHKFILFGPDDIVQCRECGLVYVNPQQSPELISGFFEETYIPDQNMLEREFGTWRSATLQREADFVKSAIPKGRILDIGCAGGEFLAMFSKNDWDHHGIEPSSTAARHASLRGIQIYQGVLQTAIIDRPDGYFNVVTSLDTIFLSPTPIEDVKKIYNLLSDDGIFVVEFPGLFYRLIRNVGPISLIVYRKWCHLSSVSPHLFYFSDNSFRKLLKVCGFDVETVMLEQSPLRGPRWMMVANQLYFTISRAIYAITSSKLNLAAKVVYRCRKI